MSRYKENKDRVGDRGRKEGKRPWEEREPVLSRCFHSSLLCQENAVFHKLSHKCHITLSSVNLISVPHSARLIRSLISVALGVWSLIDVQKEDFPSPSNLLCFLLPGPWSWLGVALHQGSHTVDTCADVCPGHFGWAVCWWGGQRWSMGIMGTTSHFFKKYSWFTILC